MTQPYTDNGGEGPDPGVYLYNLVEPGRVTGHAGNFPDDLVSYLTGLVVDLTVDVEDPGNDPIGISLSV